METTVPPCKCDFIDKRSASVREVVIRKEDHLHQKCPI